MRLNEYVTLGRTGLRVSPLCFGAMTFGTEWGWGADETTSKQMFDRYLDAGGNFIDTADAYTNGHSEELVGKFVGDANLRDRMVIATKFTFNASPGNPNSGGNGRKNIYRALEASLRRLKMDYVDLYYLHAWDPLLRSVGLPRLVRRARANHRRKGRQGAHRHSAARILADRAHPRARAHSRRAGAWHRHLPLGRDRRRIPQRKIQA